MGGLGVLQLVFQQVLIGRPAPMMAVGPVTSAIAYLSAVALIVSAVQLWRERPTPWLLVGLSVSVFAYSGVSNLYVIATNFDYGFALTSFGKAMTLGAALLFFYRIVSSTGTDGAFTLVRLCTGLFLIIGGVQHFLFSDFVKLLIPGWLPFAAFWTYAAGVALIVAGLSLVIHIKVKWIAYGAGWMIFTWVLVLHIPRALAEPNANELSAVCEALSVSMILFALSKLDNH